MSEFLQNLGRQSISPTSISKSNYQEFDDLDDATKAVNKNNDAFVKGVTEEAEAAARFYQMAHRNQSGRLAQLAEITKTGGEVAKQWKTFRENSEWYNTSLKKYMENENLDDDPEVETEKEREIKLRNAQAQAKLTSWNQPEILKASILSAAGLFEKDFDEKQEMTSAIEKIFPAFSEAFADQEITSTIDGKTYKLSELGIDQRDIYDDLIQIRNKLFLQLFDGKGYRKGQIKRNLLIPLFQLSEKESADFLLANAKAKNDLLEYNSLRLLAIDLNKGNYDSFLKDINLTHATGTSSWANARNIGFGKLEKMIDMNLISSSVIEKLGRHEFEDHTNKTVRLEDYWGKHGYNAILAKASNATSIQLDQLLKGVENDSKLFLLENLNTWRNQKTPVTVAQVRKAIEHHKTHFGDVALPTEYNTYLNRLENPDEDLIEKMLEDKFLDKQNITEDDLIGLGVELRKKWLPYVNYLNPSDAGEMDDNISVLLKETLSWASPAALMDQGGAEYMNNYKRAKDVYYTAFSEVQLKYKGIDIPLVEVHRIAHATGNDAVRRFLTETHGTQQEPNKTGTDSLKGLAKLSDKDLNLNIASDELKKALSVSPNKNINQSDFFDGEEEFLRAGLVHLTRVNEGKPSKLDYFWTLSSSGSNISATDLLKVRLNATGLAEELGFPITFSPETTVLSDPTQRLLQYKNTPSSTLIAHNQNSKDLAEILKIKAGNNTIDTITSKGEKIESPKPISQMNLGELFEYLQTLEEDDLVGLYSIPRKELGPVLKEMYTPPYNPLNTTDETVFDEAFQNKLYFFWLRQKIGKNQANVCVRPENLAAILNINIEQAKEFDVLCRVKGFFDTEEKPFMKFLFLLPGLQKALIKEVITK